MTLPTAIVTGAAGLMGSHTVEALLTRGYRVRAIDLDEERISHHLGEVRDHPGLSVVTGNLLDIPAESEVFAGADWLFHCAGLANQVPSMTQPELYMQVNVMGTVRVLEAARHHGFKKVLNVSSGAVYGSASVPTAEDHPILLDGNPYALTKWMGEEVCLHWHRVYGVPSISFRLFNCYGPRAVSSGPVGAFLRMKREGRPITVTGDGSQTRDFIYIGDVIEAFLAGAASDKAGTVYNVGSGVPETVLSLAKLFDCPIEFIAPRAGEPKAIQADIGRIKADLGWTPKVSLAEGIGQLLRFEGLWSS